MPPRGFGRRGRERMHMETFVRSVSTVRARKYDVVVCGGGTSGLFAALAAARNGASTALVEHKGYIGGIAAEGGCGLHSFYNLYKAFPDVQKKKVIRGLPEEFIDRLTAMGGASGHNETLMNYGYDSDTLCVDVEIYKQLANTMLAEAGVDVLLNTMAVDADVTDGHINAVFTESHEGCEALAAKVYIDATGFGDLSARAGAKFLECSDYAVANSIGVAGIDIDAYYQCLKEHGALKEYALGKRGGVKGKLIRVDGDWEKLNPAWAKRAKEIGMQTVTTTLHDSYFMFIKLNVVMPVSPLYRDALADAEIELRRRQAEAIRLLREAIPGGEHAFITRTSPMATIRRARCIQCDYDLSNEEILNATHFRDDVFAYGFHDEAPSMQVRNGSTYGFPLRAMQVHDCSNLYAIGMMVTSNHDAHMSTRNTVSCMAQGQAAGTAAALAAGAGFGSIRDLPYGMLKDRLLRDGVYFEEEPLTVSDR